MSARYVGLASRMRCRIFSVASARNSRRSSSNNAQAAYYCDIVEELFSNEPRVVTAIAEQRSYLEDVISDLEAGYSDEENDRTGDDESYGVSTTIETSQGARDVFEDVADPN
jgi:hypothetical protein